MKFVKPQLILTTLNAIVSILKAACQTSCDHKLAVTRHRGSIYQKRGQYISLTIPARQWTDSILVFVN